MANNYAWSDNLDETNGSSDGDINWAEQQAPSTVNDSARNQMATHARWYEAALGGLTTTGGALSYALTTQLVNPSLSLKAGMQFGFKAHITCGANPTLNVNATGPKKLYRTDGNQVRENDILLNRLYMVWYDPALDSATGGWVLMGYTSLNERLGRSIADFGAIPNDSSPATQTANTTAIQNAIDANEAVFIPEGIFWFDGSLSITKTGQYFYGIGRDVCVLKYTGNSTVFNVADGVDYLTFLDFQTYTTADAANHVTLTNGNTYFNYNRMVFFADFSATRTGAAITSGPTTSFNGFHTFNDCRFQNHFYGIYQQATAAESTEFVCMACEFNVCTHAIYDIQTSSGAGHFRVFNGSCEVGSSGRNQIVTLGFGNSIFGMRMESQTGWGTFVNGDYTTKNPIHFGPTAQRNYVSGVEFIPFTEGSVFLDEGTRSFYNHAQEKMRIYKALEFKVNNGFTVDANNTRAGVGIDAGSLAHNFQVNATSATLALTDGTYTGRLSLASGGGGAGALSINALSGSVNIQSGGQTVGQGANNVFRPGPDNVVALGGASNRWSEVFAGTGTINTSDRREKQDFEEIPEGLLEAVKDVKIQLFRWINAVSDKGEKARYHIGVIVQDFEEACKKHGVDPSRYGLFCEDEIFETVTETRTERRPKFKTVETQKLVREVQDDRIIERVDTVTEQVAETATLPLVDGEGNAILDERGRPVYEEVFVHEDVEVTEEVQRPTGKTRKGFRHDQLVMLMIAALD